MSQDKYYNSLLSLMKDLSSKHASKDEDGSGKISVAIKRSKVEEESVDEAAELDNEKLQNRKEDGQDENVTSDQRPVSDTSAKYDEGMSLLELVASGSVEIQTVGEVSNEVLSDRQQKWMDLFGDYEYSIPIPGCEKSHSLYRSCLDLFYEGQYENAKTICEIILEELLNTTRTYDNDIQISNFFEMLASIYRKTNRYDDAIILFAKAIEIHKAIHGSDHVIVAITLNNLGICHAKVGNYAEALNLCGTAFDILVENDGILSLSRQFYCLGALHQMQDQYESAEWYYEKAQARYSILLKDDHRELKKVVRNLTTCYLKQGKVKEAAALQ